ncbi:metalloprotease PmbA [Sinimarinibacterium sp. NLF-5-8]|uniref:metalloprotease PmbA n=1 Tax=Sinimarinibacterium sp. NLF-5-8 TaxID=2698684 RepID=UPI00137C0A34|nr:metalloprotease PmbA [Sinimarinibacterium sp. NLF-5-8]QHS10505.1 metalloprotease PmbA [Sinimarinibacterium sp. NLF-5-8]
MTAVAESADLLPTPEFLQRSAEFALETARANGATQASVGLSGSRGFSVNVRNGEVESLEFQQDRDLGISVYIGQQKGHASTGDLSDAGIRQAVLAALDIARATGADPFNGLAEAALMADARGIEALDLDHPWAVTPEQAIDLACIAENAAFAVDARISASDGASVNTHRGRGIYANSHGFYGISTGSSHSISCVMVGGSGSQMQRDYWYSSARSAEDLLSAESIGRIAGERTLAKLGARKIDTCTAPVLFVPQLARGLWGHLLGAMSGGALYRRASFLLDQMGEPICAPHITLAQRPFIPRGAGSALWDAEGVAARERTLVKDGVLQGWLLGSYSARKLGLQTTGNAGGGAYNLLVSHGDDDFAALLRRMDRGLLVTELMGSGANTMTGDYSRGAAGFWVENGQIAYPVQEITIASTLQQMLKGIVAVGCDVETSHSIRTGSVLIEQMRIAGKQ